MQQTRLVALDLWLRQPQLELLNTPLLRLYLPAMEAPTENVNPKMRATVHRRTSVFLSLPLPKLNQIVCQQLEEDLQYYLGQVCPHHLHAQSTMDIPTVLHLRTALQQTLREPHWGQEPQARRHP